MQTVFLLVALWFMLKVQKLQYNFLGLLGTAVLGSALDMIPLAGHYISVVALYFCIWKMTRADLFPDAVFTVVVAYALMFCMNLFLLGALMGDLRASTQDDEFGLDAIEMETEVEYDSGVESAPGIAASTKKPKSADSKSSTGKYAGMFTLKAVVLGTAKSTVTISAADKDYVLGVGETVEVRVGREMLTVKCEKADKSVVILSVGGETVRLFH
ncbi:MAG TPA: hypothetical protein PKA41_18820 [Verrucomicrobiota bacterium]|nr:hypothetical protein [Verrucomicrobiota bacterium]